MSWVVGFVGVLAGVAGPAAATPMVVSWTTWLRTGPGERARVIDEVPAGWPVEVAGCVEGWCRVTSGQASGYMRRDMLADALRPMPRGSGDCVRAEHFIPEKPLPLRLCAGQ